MKFRFLTGDVDWRTYGGMFISKKLNNGDFDYWLVLHVDNLGDDANTYHVSLSAVSPQQAQAHLQPAFECCGIPVELQSDPMIQVESLASYGVTALLWSEEGNNLKNLLKQAHEQAEISTCLFGFYMDAPQNRIGNTGWDCIRGDIGF